MESSARRPCFIEEDDGLASLADMEAGFSGSHGNHHPFLPRFGRSGSFSNLSMLSSSSSSAVVSSRPAGFYDARYEDRQPHFLKACFLCEKVLGGNRDIFMYRGDTPFCSEECRQEQIGRDEAKEKNRTLSSSMKALRKRSDQKNSTSPPKTQDYRSRTGTVAAA